MPVKSYKDKNGRVRYYAAFYYTDHTGARKKKKKEGFTRASAAKQFEADFLEQVTGSSEMTFRNLCEVYLKDCKARLKATTYRGKVYMFQDKIIPAFDRQPITRVTPAMVRSWQNSIIQHPQGYSPTYQRTINNQMTAVFNYAVKYYGLKRNPVRVAGTIGKKLSGRLDFWTLEEYNRFIRTIPPTDPAHMAFELLFYSGIREGELLGLCVNDFDPEAGALSITKTFARQDGQDLILPPKTPKSKRIVTLPRAVCDHMAAYIPQLYAPEDNPRMFFMLSKSLLGRKLKAAASAAGIKPIRIHDLRHSHASLLIELGFSPLVISERLGHEKIETTLQIYSHLYPNKASEVAAKLDNFLK